MDDKDNAEELLAPVLTKSSWKISGACNRSWTGIRAEAEVRSRGLSAASPPASKPRAARQDRMRSAAPGLVEGVPDEQKGPGDCCLWRRRCQRVQPSPFSGRRARDQNRYKNIWPYDYYARVRLSSPADDDSDYINASYNQPRGTTSGISPTQGLSTQRTATSGPWSGSRICGSSSCKAGQQSNIQGYLLTL